MGEGVGNRRGAARPPRLQGDDGTGLFPMMTSVFIVLIMLGFAVHVLVGLYARSVVAGAAYDAASYLARNGGTGDAHARTIVVQQLDASTVLAAERIDPGDPDHVTYRVQARAPKFFALGFMPGGDTIERSARARIERQQS